MRVTTHIALSEIERRGPLLRRLLNEPSLTGAVGLVRMRGHDANARYLARRIQREFDVSTAQALKLTEIGLGLTIAAGDLIQRGGAQREDIEETTCAMIIGAVRAGPVEIARRYNEQGADELTFLDITAPATIATSFCTSSKPLPRKCLFRSPSVVAFAFRMMCGVCSMPVLIKSVLIRLQ